MKGSLLRSFASIPFLGLLLLLLLVLVMAVVTHILPGVPLPPQSGAGEQRARATWAALPTWTPRPTGTPRLPTPTPAQPVVRSWSFEPAGTDATQPGSLRAAVVITFDQYVAPERVAQALSVSPPISGSVTPAGERSLAFTPALGWRPDAYYSIGIASARGVASFAFRTAPWLRVTLPTSGATVQDLHGAVKFVFGYPVDPAQIEAGLRVEPDTPHHLRWWYQTLFLEPAEAWAPDTTYTVTLDVTTTGEARFPPDRPGPWVFHTRSGVLEFGPVKDVSVCGPVTITFDRPIDHASVEGALQITPSVAVSLDWQDNRLGLAPDGGWLEGATYQVRLDPSLRAADGTPLLRHPFQANFTTGTAAGLDFGEGPNVQVLDAAGPRRVQFSHWHSQPSCAQFLLYQASREWLLGAYSSSFKAEAPLPDISGLPLVRQWQGQVSLDETALPADVPPGLYVLTTQISGGDGLLIVLTHYTLVLKEAGVGAGTTAEHQVAGFASAIATKLPQPGMIVRLYDRSGRLYGEGTTDVQGRFETTVPGDTDPLLALGEVDGEVTLCGFGPEWNAEGHSGWWGWSPTPPAGRRYRVYVYTDRPIYRPGQTVYVKAIVRADDDALYSLLPVGTPVTVRLRDARDNVIGTQALAASEFGTVNTTFTLAEGGTLGTYNAEVVVGEEVTRQALKVEEYRKPDYEVAVSVDQQQVLVGQAISVTVEARYYFGQPVVGVPVTLHTYQRIYDYWDCDGEAGCWDSRDTYSGQTDAQGRCQFRLAAPEVNYAEAAPVSLEATVADGSGQAVSSHSIVQVYRNRYGTSLLLDRYTFNPGEDIPVGLMVRDYRGNPVADAVLKVGLYTWNGQSWAYDSPVVEVPATSDVAGRAHTALRLGRQGWYRLGVTGNYGQAEAWVWIYDPASSAPWGDLPSGLQVSVDKSAYVVGETARLVVGSPVTGTALLTLERGRVRRIQPIELTGAVTTVPLIIEGDFAPNIFATVQVYRPVDPKQWRYSRSRPDAELLVGSAELVVPVPERELQVTIAPERTIYSPREEATVVIQVNDSAGWPARAELSLAMVDEAIYALSQELALDPFEAFYGRRSNLVRTYHSLQPTRYLGDGMGGGGGGFSLGNPRRNFPDTAYWNPAIVTDENGRAVVTIPLPDSLTRWRLLARAVTLETWVGQGTAALTVTQELVVRPALPRFLVQGDTLTLTATVHNYGGGPIQAQAGLRAEGLTVFGPLTYTVALAPGQTAPVNWALSAADLGTVTVTAYAATPERGDAVQYTLPVVPFAVPQVDSRAGELVGERIERFTLPEDFIPAVSQVEVRLAPSAVPMLLDGLEYLIGYPFG